MDLGQEKSSSKSPDGVFALNVPFSQGTIAVQVGVRGDHLAAAHLARVREYLKLVEKGLRPLADDK